MAETHDPCPRNSQPGAAGKGEAAGQREQFGVTISALWEMPFLGFPT